MYKKLHPDSDIHDTKDLTGAEQAEITKIIGNKHSIVLGSPWIPDKVTTDLKTLRNVLVSATLACSDKLNELHAKTIGSMSDGNGRIGLGTVEDWEDSIAYYQDQLDAIKVIEDHLLEPLREETHKEGFYMRGRI